MPNARNLTKLCFVIHSVNNSIWPKDDLAKAIVHPGGQEQSPAGGRILARADRGVGARDPDFQGQDRLTARS